MKVKQYDHARPKTKRYSNQIWESHKIEILTQHRDQTVLEIAEGFRMRQRPFLPTSDQIANHIKKWRSEIMDAWLEKNASVGASASSLIMINTVRKASGKTASGTEPNPFEQQFHQHLQSSISPVLQPTATTLLPPENMRIPPNRVSWSTHTDRVARPSSNPSISAKRSDGLTRSPAIASELYLRRRRRRLPNGLNVLADAADTCSQQALPLAPTDIATAIATNTAELDWFRPPSPNFASHWTSARIGLSVFDYYSCCNLRLDNLHELFQHFEESHAKESFERMTLTRPSTDLMV